MLKFFSLDVTHAFHFRLGRQGAAEWRGAHRYIFHCDRHYETHVSLVSVKRRTEGHNISSHKDRLPPSPSLLCACLRGFMSRCAQAHEQVLKCKGTKERWLPHAENLKQVLFCVKLWVTFHLRGHIMPFYLKPRMVSEQQIWNMNTIFQACLRCILFYFWFGVEVYSGR